jgi:hypothetical protein
MFIRNFILISAVFASLNMSAAEANLPQPIPAKTDTITSIKGLASGAIGLFAGFQSFIAATISLDLYKTANSSESKKLILGLGEVLSKIERLKANGQMNLADASDMKNKVTYDLVRYLLECDKVITKAKIAAGLAAVTGICSAGALYYAFKTLNPKKAESQPAIN